MLVTIVAKTRMGSGACIGGITDDGRSVRLIAPDMAFNDHFNMDYKVGEVWEVEADPAEEIIPPHTENIVVRRKRRVGRADDLFALIERHMPPRAGGLDVLYDGQVRGKPGSSLFIAERAGVPGFSTMFWRPDRPLVRDTSGKRIRYRYATDRGDYTLTFVGFQEPLETLPAGTLLRVSLAHWWQPDEHPDAELRCYLQLSGWFGLPEEIEFPDEEDPEETEGETGFLEDGDLRLQEARDTLRRVFGYDDFRPLQGDVIANVLARRDSLAVMPTGSGKSMCFQLPALLFPGLTVVVSPLISLMEDQVMQLRQSGVPAAYLNSTVPYDGYVSITQQIRAGRLKLLYTSPETLLRPETLVMLDECRVDCLTIDEAHCISEWGHDFRPEFRQLVQVRRRLPDAVCLAITATATERVRRDIKETLAVRDADEFIASFDRENLFLAVVPRDDGLARIVTFLDGHKGESGLIYCATRERTEELAAHLAARGWPALPYHAGLDYATRRENQRRFAFEEGIIIVATVAFGMGINKSNVRFVIHHDLPKDLENYYQQIGRAGRDGLPGDCLLLFSRQDAMTINFLLDQGEPSQRAAAAARLQAMLAFAETTGCRRRPLLAYFGEEVAADNCGRCDNCLNGDQGQADLTIPAQKFLSCAVRTGQFFGASHLIDVLRGSRSKEVLKRGHDRLPTYNIGGEFTKKEWQQLARQFVGDGLLAQDMNHGSLKLTPKGHAVLKGEPYFGAPPATERAMRHAVARDYDVHLFDQLRELRLELARQADVPAIVVFSDAALREMAIYYPQTRDTFARMQGVGAAKLERYGEAFLAVIRAYCGERGIVERPKPEAVARPAQVPTGGRPRRKQVMEMYLQGQSPESISESLNIQWNSVIFYLWQGVLEGVKLDGPTLLTQSRIAVDEREAVLRAFSQLGTARLQPVYEALQEAVPYEELHILRLYFVVQQPSALPTSDTERCEIQQAILRCVALFPGQLPRSGVAKLLVGSDSERIVDYVDYPERGRFSHLPRHIVMAEVDRLIAEGELSLDEERHLR